MKRTPEDVCIEYALAVAAVRELTRKIIPGECTTMATADALEFWQPGYKEERTEPCISQLFSLKPSGSYDREAYLEMAYDLEEAMCERCKESLQAVRERKALRKRLGAAKRSVETVGKKLQTTGASK